MIRVFLIDNQPQVHLALLLLVSNLGMQVVGEADDWFTVFAELAGTQPDMLIVDWDLIPTEYSLIELRETCPETLVVGLINHMDARQQTAISAGADAFISNRETPDRVAERLQAAAAVIRQTVAVA